MASKAAPALLLLVLDDLPLDAQIANSIDVAGSSECIARRDYTLGSCSGKRITLPGLALDWNF